MLRARAMPCLLLDDGALVKTVRFRNPDYVGDPINAVRIYNECEVDELIVLDIAATPREVLPDLEMISDLASECFMPLTYGGGIKTVEQAAAIFKLGVEKVAINSANFRNEQLIGEISSIFGSQAVVGAIEVRKPLFGGYRVMTARGTVDTRMDPAIWAAELARRGAGEILLNSVDRDGTWAGYDLELIEHVTRTIDVPVIAVGGARSVEDFGAAVRAGASAAAAGAMVVYQKKGQGVLINYPPRNEIVRVFA